ncbi:unnamed protein product [Adineta steineri]|uniref:Uncharacterized protein n=1 Tax=Adineta steineri TaxID=433720 RepID=A0A814MK56_9BILA|nr:unnamed protein product [Adineta steineri]CAF1080301.1 unnamed protein product [Adineta steineri]CAF3480722.1 unnamed protein product [Adineta steineri]CAF3711197.1 unnamed protein product [Adineta steineri]
MLFYLIVIQLHIQYVSTIWSSSKNSNIQLLGLFPDMNDISESSTFSVHSRAMFKAVILLSHQYDIRIGRKIIQWQTTQTGGDVINTLDSMCQAISSSTIAGLEFSREYSTVAALAERVGIAIAEYTTNNIYCNLTLVDTDFDKSSYGIVMPKQAPYIQDVDTCPDIVNPPTAMGIELLIGLLVTFGIINIYI